MSVFGNYSRYYDLLYKDKDYQGEADYIAGLVKRHAPDAKRLLELGCGTGKHAVLLAEKGYNVHGVDLSATMLESANARRETLPDALKNRLSFSQGNVQNCSAEGTFDAVISLFHVVSYQTRNEELLAMFKNAATHLRKGGVFIFDYWYGPAVLTDRPEVRTKNMESDAISVTRLATPVLHPVESVVDVNYDIRITDKASGKTESLKETHRMRYLFSTEIELLAKASGFSVEDNAEWMTGKAPSFTSWGVVSVLKK